jgi:hypothetical protein
MAGPSSLFDDSLAVKPAVEPDPARRTAATRLRAVLLVALLAVGLADLAVVRQSIAARSVATVAGAAVAAPPVRPTVAAPAVKAAPAVPTPAKAAPPPAPAAQDAADIAFVRRYYTLLPGRPGAAFRLLGPGARKQSGGYPRFAAFYSGIAAVSVDRSPAVVAPSTVATVIRFQRRSGEVTHERYELVVGRGPGGAPHLHSYRRVAG